jgi:cephalosporin-C deacetylase-like acetyl esterase
VQIRVSVGDSATALGAAAIEPHQIATALPPPDDFGVFWAEKKAQLAAVPVNLRMQPVPTERRGVEVFDVQADSCVGNGVSAYLARLAMGGRVI